MYRYESERLTELQELSTVKPTMTLQELFNHFENEMTYCEITASTNHFSGNIETLTDRLGSTYLKSDVMEWKMTLRGLEIQLN